MKLNYNAIGKRIRVCRISKNITQEQLAYQINSSAAYVSNIERGIKKPSLQKLVQIAEILGVTVNDFLYNSTEAATLSSSFELAEILSEYTPEKQQLLIRSLTTIIKEIRMK